MKGVVHLHRRCPTARTDALDLFQRKHAIRSRAFVSNPELFLATLQQFLSATQQARGFFGMVAT